MASLLPVKITVNYNEDKGFYTGNHEKEKFKMLIA
jgi:hypothetical protein